MESKTFLKTFNSTGYFTTTIDSFTQAFIDFCSPGKHIFETGAAVGIATIPIVAKGVRATVNDSDPGHLSEISKKIPDTNKEKVTFIPGLIQNLRYEKESFDGVFTCRMLHLLHGNDLEKVLRNFFSWLRPNGMMVITVDTPFIGWFKDNIPHYEELRRHKSKWPGFIEDTSIFLNTAQYNIPKFVNFLDLDTLERTVSEAGFSIIKSAYIPQPSFPDEVRLDGRESAGIIAVK